MREVSLLVSRQQAVDARRHSDHVRQAMSISSKIIDATPANKQERFTSVDDIIAAYNLIADEPIHIHSIYKDAAFCTLWIKLHDRLVDKFYVNLAEVCFRRNSINVVPTVPIDDAFSDWPECTVTLAINPKQQERIEKARVPRRPRLQVTREIVEHVLSFPDHSTDTTVDAA